MTQPSPLGTYQISGLTTWRSSTSPSEFQFQNMSVSDSSVQTSLAFESIYFKSLCKLKWKTSNIIRPRNDFTIGCFWDRCSFLKEAYFGYCTRSFLWWKMTTSSTTRNRNLEAQTLRGEATGSLKLLQTVIIIKTELELYLYLRCRHRNNMRRVVLTQWKTSYRTLWTGKVPKNVRVSNDLWPPKMSQTRKLQWDTLVEDMRSFRVIYEILHGVIAVESLFGDFSSNVCAAKVSKSSLSLRYL